MMYTTNIGREKPGKDKFLIGIVKDKSATNQSEYNETHREFGECCSCEI